MRSLRSGTHALVQTCIQLLCVGSYLAATYLVFSENTLLNLNPYLLGGSALLVIIGLFSFWQASTRGPKWHKFDAAGYWLFAAALFVQWKNQDSVDVLEVVLLILAVLVLLPSIMMQMDALQKEDQPRTI